jgi:hypothetical protein
VSAPASADFTSFPQPPRGPLHVFLHALTMSAENESMCRYIASGISLPRPMHMPVQLSSPAEGGEGRGEHSEEESRGGIGGSRMSAQISEVRAEHAVSTSHSTLAAESARHAALG